MVGVNSLASQESGGVMGGLGLGDRAFPPTPGLTFSTWICVDKVNTASDWSVISKTRL